MRHGVLAARRIALVLCLCVGTHAAAEETWRSALYPDDWTPALDGTEGRFLHDFSWAGYRGGEDPPDREGAWIDVVRRGADPKGGKDSTAAIQGAIDDAGRKPGGGIVHFPAGAFRVDGRLTVTRSGIVLRGEGAGRTRLRFTKVGGMNGGAHLTVRGQIKRRETIPLVRDAATRARAVHLEALDGIKAGDEIAVGIVNNEAFRRDHGMQEFWAFSDGKWRPLFRRTIAKIDQKDRAVSFTVPLRYEVRRAWGAALAVESGYVEECGIEDLAISNTATWAAAWKTNQVAAIEISGARDCWVRRVHSFAADVDTSKGKHLQSCGIRVRDSKCVTIADCSLSDPAHCGGGGNGYLFEIRSSNEVLTRDCRGERGRHNFIQNWDFGTSGCVWLRIHSVDGGGMVKPSLPFRYRALSEYHHALAMANLVDGATLDDGWNALNRRRESSGAGHTATECVIWNAKGKGVIRSMQFGHGYVIGAAPTLTVHTALSSPGAEGTAPEDFTEGLGEGAGLRPVSLYEDQRRRRRARPAVGR